MRLVKNRLVVIATLAVFFSATTNLTGETRNMSPKNVSNVLSSVNDDTDSGRKPNRLIHESSPYLLQHAYNPVDWYSWGDEAFAKARRENKPIFLSIGYSTCHWCHVMEKESFENPEIAALLNQYFVAIKVDREERPDLDQVYMAVTQTMTGSGGWPMSVFLTPDLNPFFAGTYFPPQSAFGRPGFAELLEKITKAWQQDRETIAKKAEALVQHLVEAQSGSPTKQIVDDTLLTAAAEQLTKGYDEKHGGFGVAPKFPRSSGLGFLLRYGERANDRRVLEMVFKTLREMASGGMYDQLGGGFHRYSVDAAWLVPHFEKMLYDQALLAVVYLEAAQLSHDPFFKEIAGMTLDYVLKEMQDEAGGFYSAEDADSPSPDDPKIQREGAFYLWSAQELAGVLGEAEAALVRYRFGIEEKGNVSDDPHGEFSGKNILYLSHTIAETAQHFAVDEDRVRSVLATAADKMLAVRAQRPRPHRDDKVLTSWNGLMISALAKGAVVLGQERYLKAAERAAGFLRHTMIGSGPAFHGAAAAGESSKEPVRPRELVWHRYRQGAKGIPGLLDDYAFVAQGFLDLYEASFDWKWLELARALTETQIELFADDKGGGFFETSGRDSTVIMRMKGDYDGAEPAGNSVSALNLLRIGRLLGDEAFLARAGKTLAAFGGLLRHSPSSMPQMMSAFEFMRGKPMQIVIAGDRGAPDTKALLEAVADFFLPNKVLLVNDGTPLPKALADELASLSYMTRQQGKATAYVCENYACQQPTTDPMILRTKLGQ